MKKILTSLSILALFLFTVSCTKESDKANINIIATIFPLYDFVKEVGKDKVSVSMILPPGTEAHSFEPTPQDIVKINESSMFVYIGEAMEPWAHDIIESLNNDKLIILEAGHDIEMLTEEEHDEHEEEHGHEHGENGHAFEWAGAFNLKKGEYYLTFAKKDGEYADPSMKMIVLKSLKSDEEAIEDKEETAEKLFDARAIKITANSALQLEANNQIVFNQKADKTVFILTINDPGNYVLYTEHMPFEFENKEHFFKDKNKKDIEPTAMEPEEGHDHHHHHGGKDPHIWLDFEIDQKIVLDIAKELSKIDPPNAEFYLKNAREYNSRLAQLDKKYKETIEKCELKVIMYGGHFAFGYLARRYGLSHISPYKGFSPNSEPTPQKIAQLIDQIKTNKIEYLYYEELLEPKVAKSISSSTGVKLDLLHGAHNLSKDELDRNVTFLQIMEENLTKLKKGLKYRE